MMKFKKVEVPEGNGTKEIDAVQLWFVEWQSRHGSLSCDVRTEVESFISHEVALEFKTALERAFKLLKHTTGNKVTIRTNAVTE